MTPLPEDAVGTVVGLWWMAHYAAAAATLCLAVLLALLVRHLLRRGDDE